MVKTSQSNVLLKVQNGHLVIVRKMILRWAEVKLILCRLMGAMTALSPSHLQTYLTNRPYWFLVVKDQTQDSQDQKNIIVPEVNILLEYA